MLFFMIIIGFLIDASNPKANIDVWGHVGGLIFGFCIFPVLMKPIQENDSACCNYKYWYWICLGIEVSFALGGFLGFYLGTKTKYAP